MNFLLVSQSVIPRIEIFSRRPLACFAALLCATCFALVDCEGQTLSADPSGNRDIRERITSIFHETLKQGEITVEHNGRLVTARTFVPPSKEHVDEVRRYGNNAIPILAEYLTSGSGFEKYLALRFLGLIGGSGVVETLRKVALNDTSSSFRLVALLWLTETPWDLASPIIRQVANDDTSPEVRNKAKQNPRSTRAKEVTLRIKQLHLRCCPSNGALHAQDHSQISTADRIKFV